MISRREFLGSAAVGSLAALLATLPRAALAEQPDHVADPAARAVPGGPTFCILQRVVKRVTAPDGLYAWTECVEDLRDVDLLDHPLDVLVMADRGWPAAGRP